MDNKLKQEMMFYYNERAEEYDELYTMGKIPASIPKPGVYRNGVAKISKMLSAFGRGHLIDIACGTGFWLPYYEKNCSQITLIDQLEKMLSECKKRVDKLGLNYKCHFVQGDFPQVTLENCVFDSAFVGFFISHLSSELEEEFFIKLRRVLKPKAQLMVIDSPWNTKRQQHRKKEGIQKRVLNDGRIFTIYKRYFNKSDIEEVFKGHLFKLESSYFGDVFLAAAGQSHE